MKKYRRSKYDEDPVYYCKDCMSLRIKRVAGQDYCDECGNADIGKMDIEDWLKAKEERYGRKKRF